MIGSSAGIFGIFAYYTLRFPKAKMTLFFWRLRFIWIRLPIYGFFGFYLMLQLVYLYFQMHGISNVSALGHIGGIIVGLAAGLYSRKKSPIKY